MADIKIKRTKANSEETTVEVLNLDYGADDLTTAILEVLTGGKKQAPVPLAAEKKTGEEPVAPEENAPTASNFRMIESGDITPEDFKTAVEEGNVDELISTFDEIDIPLDTGGTVTVVCAYSAPETACFVFKDCWDEDVMNDEATNEGGYFKSAGRKHVLEDIWPHIATEWQAIIKPRKLAEEIGGERIEYADPMWLLSATDVFGSSEDGYWKDIDNSFQLPIFKRERDRVKECSENGTYPWWLRAVYATYSSYFRIVFTGGSGGSGSANSSYGFAPGFDI